MFRLLGFNKKINSHIKENQQNLQEEDSNDNLAIYWKYLEELPEIRSSNSLDILFYLSRI